jgi:hypothetical protein
VVATDEEVYRVLLSLWTNVVLMNGRDYSRFGGFCFLKQAVQEFCVNAGFEVTVLDGDNAFFLNPMDLFNRSLLGCDFVFQQEMPQPLSNAEFSINIGIFTAVPSNLTRLILQMWRSRMKAKGEYQFRVATDQELLTDMFRSWHWVFDAPNRRFLIDLPREFGLSRPAVVGMFSPINFTHWCHIPRILPGMIERAETWRPHMIHLAWTPGAHGKRKVMEQIGYDFVVPDLKCKENPTGLNWTGFLCSRGGLDHVDGRVRDRVARLACMGEKLGT